MSIENNNKPLWFTVFAWVMVMWNLLGVATFALHALSKPELGRLPPEHQALYASEPWWSVLAFGVAVVAGLAGAGALMLGRRQAFGCYLVSLAGVLVQQFYSFGVADSLKVLGTGSLAMPLFVLVLTLAQLLVAKLAGKRGWVG
ncbi:MAG: hypothetical protein VX447_16620 [Pseudomonadota bacterium]|uniref:hypothetical protein n=1 Tax=Gallaecimonas pentaromativorans TaxID=584787 RepID=UPI00067F0C2E|nr:hypothetical protein [Gallaecimonas pentaromativorans]MED5526360.1 hypothetical protein [Pseudomonadota bacterium]